MQLTFCHAMIMTLLAALVGIPAIFAITALIQRITTQLKSVRWPAFQFRPAFAGSFVFATCAIFLGIGLGHIEIISCGKSDAITRAMGENNPITIVAVELPCNCDK